MLAVLSARLAAQQPNAIRQTAVERASWILFVNTKLPPRNESGTNDAAQKTANPSPRWGGVSSGLGAVLGEPVARDKRLEIIDFAAMDMAGIEARLARIEITGERLPPAILKLTYR